MHYRDALARAVTGAPVGERTASVSAARDRMETTRASTVRRALLVVELMLIVLWGCVVTRPYLDLDPMVVPAGPEYGQDVMPHYFWTRVRECGWCAAWFGGARGGTPAFIEP